MKKKTEAEKIATARSKKKNSKYYGLYAKWHQNKVRNKLQRRRLKDTIKELTKKVDTLEYTIYLLKEEDRVGKYNM